MKLKLILSFVTAVLAINSSTAQNADVFVSPKELGALVGCWQGTLHYSGTIIRKPYSTPAVLVVQRIGKSPRFELMHIYNPATKTHDTITLSQDGKRLNDATIKSKTYTPDGNMEVVTEIPGFDHDNNTTVTIRQTYLLGKDTYNYKKEVLPEGQQDWLGRQEFTYSRKPTSKK